MAARFATVADYLAAVSPERRAIIEAVRRVILANLDPDIEEGIQYNMIGYYVPHRVFAPGYHCDPRQPLPVASLAAQKHHFSLNVMALYMGEAGGPTNGDNLLLEWFVDAWTATGHKLDMGKCCVRFRSLDDIPLGVVAMLFRRISAKAFVEHYLSATARSQKNPTAKKSARKSAR